MSDRLQQALRYIDEHEADVVATLQQFIRTRSINPAFDPSSPGEGAMAALVAERWRRLGFEVETIAAEPGRPNVIARRKGTAPGPRLLVNAHLDTHPAYVGPWVDPYTGEWRTEWSVDAFSGELRDGRIYGRGAVDHKSPIAALLHAVEALDAAGIRLGGELTVIHDVDEETGGSKGMAYLAQVMPMDFDMALYATTTDVTDLGKKFFSSTGRNNIFRAMSGRIAFRIKVSGVNLHTLSPRWGLGAAEAALRLLDLLRPLMDRLNAYVCPVEGRGQPLLRVTAIESSGRGASHHQARECTIHLSRRVPVSHTLDQARAEIHEVVELFRRQYPEHAVEVEETDVTEPYECPEDAPIVQGFARAVRRALGEEPNVTGLPSPVGLSALLNRIKLPAVVFGYGIVQLHHAIDEHIAVRDLMRMTRVYAAGLVEVLGEG
ncbi:MAG TPA: M20 family metallopeptidase [Limnochordales bacterium]